MAKKNNDFEKQDEQLQEVNNALSGAGKWIEEHSKMLSWIITIIALAVLGYFAYQQFIVIPRQKAATEANGAILMQDAMTRQQMAQNGDENPQTTFAQPLIAAEGDAVQGLDGFVSIADEYGNQQGELAALYAGICYYEVGRYEDAVLYLERFSAKDVNINAAAHQLLGDAYTELAKYDEAIEAYQEVVKDGNKILAPCSLRKAGIVYLKKGDKAGALEVFNTIKEEYPASIEAADIDKYIAIAQ